MSHEHQRFSFQSLQDVRDKAQELSVWLPLEEELAVLAQPLRLAGGLEIANRLALQPMEGSDSTPDGGPTNLTFRRYERFARGGAGLIWMEAVAINYEAKASRFQLQLTEGTLDKFARLVARIKEEGLRANGYAPVVIMQATHSGRYSKLDGVPAPIIAYNNPIFEGENPLDPSCIATDDDLRRYEADYETVTRLAQRAGFDGIDIKSCHRYLSNELMSAYTRPGPYGGDFENRTRFLRNCFRAAKAGSTGGFLLTSRMNAYDGYPYPYGFGVDTDGGVEPKLDEAVRLVRELKQEFGLPLVNITIGNPYTNPHVNRPYDKGNYVPGEHPLEGVSRMMRCVSRIAQEGGVSVMGSAFSYLRQYSPQLAAGMVAGGHAALAGFGRMAFADPDFPNQVLRQGGIPTNQVCVACGQCAMLLRQGKPAGCVVRDRETYQAGGPV